MANHETEQEMRRYGRQCEKNAALLMRRSEPSKCTMFLGHKLPADMVITYRHKGAPIEGTIIGGSKDGTQTLCWENNQPVARASDDYLRLNFG